jgi:hypothetical protein
MYTHPTLFLATSGVQKKFGVIKNNPIKHTRSRTDGSHVKGVKTENTRAQIKK